MLTVSDGEHMTEEWREWHKGYEGNTNQAKRLGTVVALLKEALERAPLGPIHLISICAGDGRDLWEALTTSPRYADVTARLVELDGELVHEGRALLAQLSDVHIEFVEGDASQTEAYAGAVPAEVVQVCGVFGNISDEDVANTIHLLPTLLAPRGTVIWTRGRFEPDLTPAIRGWFGEAGFEELAFVPIPGSTASVGAHRLAGNPRPFDGGRRLFTFLPWEERPSNRGKSQADRAPGGPVSLRSS